MESGSILSAVQGIQDVRYAELGSSVIILYDHLVTLDVEINLIWRSGWTLGKVLFLMNRYYTLLAVIFNNYILFSPNLTDEVYALTPHNRTALIYIHTIIGFHWLRWQWFTGIVVFSLSELILQLRLYAMYSLDKRVLALMGTSFLAAVGATITITCLILAKITTTSHDVPWIPFCIPNDLIQESYLFWIPMLASESVLCGLALFRGYQSFQDYKTLDARHPSLIQALIEDSILYFVVIFATYLCNTMIFVTGKTSLMEATIGYSVAFSCVMSNRLCLNVRGMVGHEREDFSVATSINRLFDHIHSDSTFVREPQSTFTPECNVGDVNFVNESFHGVPQPVEDIERRGEAI